MKQNKTRILGLTGNIGSGKSSVSAILKKNSGYIIDTDKLAHAVIEPGGSAYGEVLEYYGNEILSEANNAGLQFIDRKKLGNIVFSDRKKLQQLMDITYKHITREVNRLIEYSSGFPESFSFIVIDAPMLFESGLETVCDEIWVVWAKDSIRLSRILERDGITRENALLRMSNQKTTYELLKCAEQFTSVNNAPLVVIENNSSLSRLEVSVCGFLYN